MDENDRDLAARDQAAIGGWRIVRRLGAGGMGLVHLAEDDQGRLAAIKTIHPALAADEHFRARFRREVALCRRVTGDRVAELVDADTEAASPWLAVRYIEGPTLAEYIGEHGPLPADALSAFALGTAQALADIHAAAIIHRDLKPSNVILADDGPVLIDFGIATAADMTAVTAVGSGMGTAGWTAPEVLRGETATAKSDVFGWAGLVAFASTGRPPFGVGPADIVNYRAAHEPPDLEGVSPEWTDTLALGLGSVPAERLDLPAILRQAGPDLTVAELIGATWHLAPPTVPDRPLPPQVSARRAVRWRAALVVAACVGLIGLGVLLARSPARHVAASATGTTTTSLATTTVLAPSKFSVVSAPPTTLADPTLADYNNFTYFVSCGDLTTPSFTLTKGVSQRYGSDIAPTEVELVGVTRGDVTGDGRPEALVELRCIVGNSAFGMAVVFAGGPHGPVPLGGALTGWSPQIVHGDVILYVPRRYENGEPGCCPSRYDKHTYHYEPNAAGFVEPASPEIVPASEVPTN